jgi:hypothetical protein
MPLTSSMNGGARRSCGAPVDQDWQSLTGKAESVVETQAAVQRLISTIIGSHLSRDRNLLQARLRLPNGTLAAEPYSEPSIYRRGMPLDDWYGAVGGHDYQCGKWYGSRHRHRCATAMLLLASSRSLLLRCS